MSRRALVLVSGGLGSAACLLWAVRQYDQVYALTLLRGEHGKAEKESQQAVGKVGGVSAHLLKRLDAGEKQDGEPETLAYLRMAAKEAKDLQCGVVVLGTSRETKGNADGRLLPLYDALAGELRAEAPDVLPTLQFVAPLMDQDAAGVAAFVRAQPNGREALADLLPKDLPPPEKGESSQAAPGSTVSRERPYETAEDVENDPGKVTIDKPGRGKVEVDPESPRQSRRKRSQ